MLWKERHAHGRLSRRAARLAIAMLVLLVAGPLIEPASASFREWCASWRMTRRASGGAGSLNESLRQLDAGLYVIGLVAVAAMAATSVTGERERGTWTSLTMTFVDGREVARAKVSGAVRAVRGLAIPFGILWGIGLATGSVHPLGVLAPAAGLVIFLRYGAALGVLFSMISPTSGQAVAATALALFASNAIALLFVPLDLIGPLAGQWTTLYLAGVSPFVEWIALVSPVEIRWSLEGARWEKRIGLPGGLWGTRILLVPGLIRTYLAQPRPPRHRRDGGDRGPRPGRSMRSTGLRRGNGRSDGPEVPCRRAETFAVRSSRGHGIGFAGKILAYWLSISI